MKQCSKCLKTKEESCFYSLKSYMCKECKCQQSRAWRAANSDRVAQRKKDWYEKNKDKAISYARKYYQDNKETIIPKIVKYRSSKIKIDPIFKLRKSLCHRLGKLIKQQSSSIAVDFLGCSLEELKSHLESKFEPGMTWENHGKWHIDHKRPLSSFDLTNSEELKEACRYTNLQPLWAQENLRKGDKLV